MKKNILDEISGAEALIILRKLVKDDTKLKKQRRNQYHERIKTTDTSLCLK